MPICSERTRADILTRKLANFDRLALNRWTSGKVKTSIPNPDEKLALVPPDLKGELPNKGLFPASVLRYDSFATRAECHEQGIPHFNVHVLVFDWRGNLFVQRRDLLRTHGAGKLAQTVGGHVTYGLTSWETALKEGNEEAGLDLTGRLYEFARFWYVSDLHRNHELVSLYAVQLARGEKCRPGEEVFWIEPFSMRTMEILREFSFHQFSAGFLQDLCMLQLATDAKKGKTANQFIRSLQGSLDPF